MILAAGSLARRELVRFFRQRSRVIGALGTPVLFWLLIGSGFDRLEYLFPGTLVMILLFTAIFSTISIIEDRKEGFLQGVLVAPVPRAAVVLGKILGGGAVAMIQAVLFLALAPAAGLSPGFGAALAAVGMMAVLAFGLTALGVFLAWRFESVQGFHAIMNLVLIPLWLLSGAVVSMEDAAGWMRGVMVANPLTYGVGALRGLLGDPAVLSGLDGGVTAGFAVVMFLLACVSAAER